jgi:hypothetical protein
MKSHKIVLVLILGLVNICGVFAQEDILKGTWTGMGFDRARNMSFKFTIKFNSTAWNMTASYADGVVLANESGNYSKVRLDKKKAEYLRKVKMFIPSGAVVLNTNYTIFFSNDTPKKFQLEQLVYYRNVYDYDYYEFVKTENVRISERERQAAAKKTPPAGESKEERTQRLLAENEKNKQQYNLLKEKLTVLRNYFSANAASKDKFNKNQLQEFKDSCNQFDQIKKNIDKLEYVEIKNNIVVRSTYHSELNNERGRRVNEYYYRNESVFSEIQRNINIIWNNLSESQQKTFLQD